MEGGGKDPQRYNEIKKPSCAYRVKSHENVRAHVQWKHGHGLVFRTGKQW